MSIEAWIIEELALVTLFLLRKAVTDTAMQVLQKKMMPHLNLALATIVVKMIELAMLKEIMMILMKRLDGSSLELNKQRNSLKLKIRH